MRLHGGRRARRLGRRLAGRVAFVIVAWAALAYLVLPALWSHHEHRPGMRDIEPTTRTADGIPGDPINVGIEGGERDLVRAMHAIGWHPADAVTLRSSVAIVDSVLLDRPYPDAPVSPLFYFGRKQDLAFELPVGESADERHHVRFWRAPELGAPDRPLWLGAVTFDRGVGLSHTTGQVTHHIAADVDAERDALIGALASGRLASEIFQVTGVGPTLFGRNGGGDRYVTDGEITVAVLTPGAQPQAAPPRVLPSPLAASLQDFLVSPWLRFAR